MNIPYKKISLMSILFIFCQFLGANDGLTLPPGNISDKIYKNLELRGYVSTFEETPYVTSDMTEAFESSSVHLSDSVWKAFGIKRVSRYSGENNSANIYIEPGLWVKSNDNDSKLYYKGRVGASARKGKFGVIGQYYIDSWFIEDSLYAAKKWDGKSGRLEQGYVFFADNDWRVALGKQYTGWGNGLLLNDECFSMEALKYNIDFWNNFRFSGYFAYLDKYKQTALDPYQIGDPYYNRYVAGHKFELKLKKLNLYALETVIWGGPNRNIEPYYLLPVSWIHAEQLNKGIDDNTFISLGFKLNLSPLRVKGEFMIDDFQIEDELQADQEPSEIAWKIQSDYALDLFDKWNNISVSYEGVTNRTYNQVNPWNRYLYENRPIGSQLGCDADYLKLELEYWHSPNFILKLYSGIKRNGEGRIDTLFDTPWMDIEGDYSESFPYGIVERTLINGIELEGYIKNIIKYSFVGESRNIQNKSNVKGQKCNEFEMRINFDLYFSFKNS